MKIAICGQGPLSVIAACKLHLLGAQVHLYGELENLVSSKLATLKNPKFFDDLSRQAELVQLLDGELTNIENFYKSLLDYCQTHNIIKPHRVNQVNKAYLCIDSELTQKERFKDLFRVLYSVKNNQISLDQELAEHLPEKLKKDLQGEYELYQDYDVVIDATGYTRSCFLGNSGSYCLGERYLKGDIHYNLDFLKMDFSPLVESKLPLLVVGKGPAVDEFLVQLQKEGFFNYPYKNTLYLKDFQATSDNPLLAELNQEIERQYHQDIKDFQVKMNEWKCLADFERVKVAKPNEPNKPIKYIDNLSVTSIDKLDDQEGLFVTFERPAFMGEEFFLTQQFSKVFVIKGYKKDFDLYDGLKFNSRVPNEVGFYTLYKEEECQIDLSVYLNRIKEIEVDLQKLFSPVE